MQTNLEFEAKKQYNSFTILPEELNPCYLSPSSQFLMDLESFNQQYNVNLSVQNAGKWAIGTYELIKDLGRNIMFPKWNQKNGANAIHKFKQYNTWRYDKVIDDLKALDDKLYEMRQSNIKLFSDDHKVEGEGWINAFNNKIIKAAKTIDFKVEYTNIPYFDNRKSHYQLYPLIYDLDCEIDDYIGNVWNGDEDKPVTYFPHSDMSKPSAWYFNILIPLKDVKITLKKAETKSYQVPYGDLIVGFSIKVSELFMLSNLVKTPDKFNRKLGIGKGIGGFTYKFPHRRSVQHPFVSDRGHGIHVRHFGAYDIGNTCFGDFKPDIFMHLTLGNITSVKGILELWATNFPVRIVSPLNNTSRFVFGTNQKLKDLGVVVDHGLCRDELDNSSDEFKEEFREEYCNSCDFAVECSTYKVMMAELIKLEFNDDEKELLGKNLLLYDNLVRFGSNRTVDVFVALCVSNIGYGDYAPTIIDKTFNPNKWEEMGYLYPKGHIRENMLKIDVFLNNFIPIAERIYAFHLIRNYNVAAYQGQIDAKEEDKKTTKNLFKQYSNLRLANGGNAVTDLDNIYYHFWTDLLNLGF